MGGRGGGGGGGRGGCWWQWGRGKGGGKKRRWERRLGLAPLEVRVRAAPEPARQGPRGSRGRCEEAPLSERVRAGGRARRPKAVVGGSRERRAQLHSGACGRACALSRRSRGRGGGGGWRKRRGRSGRWGGTRRPSLPPSRGAAAAALPPPLRRHFGFALRRGRRSPSRLRDPPPLSFSSSAPRLSLLLSHISASPLTRWPPLDKRGGSAVDQGKRRSLVAAVPSSPLPCTLISGPRPLTRERDAGCKFWRFLFFMEHNSVKYS